MLGNVSRVQRCPPPRPVAFHQGQPLPEQGRVSVPLARTSALDIRLSPASSQMTLVHAEGWRQVRATPSATQAAQSPPWKRWSLSDLSTVVEARLRSFTLLCKVSRRVFCPFIFAKLGPALAIIFQNTSPALLSSSCSGTQVTAGDPHCSVLKATDSPLPPPSHCRAPQAACRSGSRSCRFFVCLPC